MRANQPPPPLSHSECGFSTECSWSNEMLAMGTMPAARDGGASGRLKYQEIHSFTTGEAGNMPRLNLQAFLPLRARV